MNSAEAKSLNEHWLRGSGVTVNPALPKSEEPAVLTPRSAEKVATRAWVLSYVLGVGMGRSADEVLDQLRAVELLDFLTPRERNVLRKPKFSHQIELGPHASRRRCTDAPGQWASSKPVRSKNAHLR